MKWTTQKKIGAGIVAIGLAPLLTVICVALIYSLTNNEMPLDTPMQLKPGEFRSPEFKTLVGVQYSLSLVGDAVVGKGPFGGPDLERLWCMMGITGGPRMLDCSGVEQEVDFDWQLVSRQGQVIESGTYKPIGYGNLHAEFAEIQTHDTGRQHVILKMRRDGRNLNARHLRLQVEGPGSDLDLGLPILVSFSGVWAVIVAFIGALVFLVPWPRKVGSGSSSE